MKHWQAKWNDSDGTRIWVEGWEPEETTAGVVCLVHGLGEHCGRYAHVAQLFNEANLSLISFDLRGHGRSGGKRGHVPSYELFLEEIDALLRMAEECYPAVPKILYGHSLGGAMVLYYTLRRRPEVAGVVSTAPALKPAFEPPAWKTKLGATLDRIWPTLAMSNGLDPNDLSRDPQVVAAYLADPLVHDRISVRLFNDWTRSVEEVFEQASTFPVPLLLLHGTADRITSMPASAALADSIGSRCTFRPLEGVFHEPHNEPNREETLRSIIQWMLERIGVTAAPQ